tara:strand:- start:950 stop:1762 length:813 start_codon:yes stop_codon:yes gene_type:complete
MNLIDKVRQSRETNRNKYFVTIQFEDCVLGALPKNPEVMRAHLMAKFKREANAAEKKGLTPPSEERINEIIAADLEKMFGKPLEDSVEEHTMQGHSGFYVDEDGVPWMGTYTVNACLREMLVCLGITGDAKRRGSKQTFQHLMTVSACDSEGNTLSGKNINRMYFYRDGAVVLEPDDFLEMTGTVRTPLGPKSIIKRHDRINGATLHFVIDVEANLGSSRAKTVITEDDIIRCLSAAESNGLGACRSMQYGKFKVVGLERLNVIPHVRGK